MKSTFLFLTMSMLVISACSDSESPDVRKDTFWVYTSRIPCNNLDTTVRCLYILDEDEIDYEISHWTRLDEAYILTDFEYEFGYFYQLTVALPDPNGTSPFAYKVVSIDQKVKDHLIDFEPSYYINQVFNTSITEEERPYYILGFEDWRRTFTANVNCQFFYGYLGLVNETDLSILSIEREYLEENVICDDKGIMIALESSKTYHFITNDSLILKDKNQEITLILERIPGYNPYGPKKP